MPLYLVLNKKEEIKDIISAENSEKAKSMVKGLNYGFSAHLIKLEKENIEQIKMAQGEEIISGIQLELEDAMMELVAVFRKVRGFEEDEPLNCDEVDELVTMFGWFAQCHEGNITDEEYRKAMSEL